MGRIPWAPDWLGVEQFDIADLAPRSDIVTEHLPTLDPAVLD